MIVPTKPIPAYKLRDRGGRFELVREVSGPRLNPRLYQGYCQFIRIACSIDGSFALLDGAAAAVYLNVDSDILRVIPGELYRMRKYDAFACLNINHGMFAGIKTMALPNFMDKGVAAGYALTVR